MTRKMKIVNSLYEWNFIMIVRMKLDCVNKLKNIHDTHFPSWNISTIFFRHKNFKIVKEKFHGISPPLQPSFTPCEHDCFCLKTLKHFRFKCLRRFLYIKFFWFLKTVLRTVKTSLKNKPRVLLISYCFLLKLKLRKQMKIILTFHMKTTKYRQLFWSKRWMN